jgi:hypothetical protein
MKMKKSVFVLGIVSVMLVIGYVVLFLGCASSPKLFIPRDGTTKVNGVDIHYRAMTVCVSGNGLIYDINCIPIPEGFSFAEEIVVSIPGLKDKFLYQILVGNFKKIGIRESSKITFLVDSVTYSINCNGKDYVTAMLTTDLITALSKCSTLSIDGNIINENGIIALKQHLDPLTKEERAVLETIMGL